MVKGICTDLEKRTGFRMEDEKKVLQDSLQKLADEVTTRLAITTTKVQTLKR